MFPGNNKKHPSSIPDNLPEFPDSHSYIRTPTHRQPVTDYEMVREKAASQKRDVERALTRFIAKTGKIHNLFKTDDNNLFPLISCEREVDGTKMPPYLNAILFKDQVSKVLFYVCNEFKCLNWNKKSVHYIKSYKGNYIGCCLAYIGIIMYTFDFGT